MAKQMKNTNKRALILFAHGARNPDWSAPFRRLQELAKSSLPDVVVELAFLEFIQPSLSKAVAKLAQQGCNDATVLPLFLGQSGHVLRDLPPMLAQLQQDYPAMILKLAKAVGEDAGVLAAMAAYCVAEMEKT